MNFGWYLIQFNFKGRPVSGGTVEFFVAGSTTTPKNIWYDVSNTVVAPNPITLDASGTMPQIYPEAGLYMIVLRDASGSLLYTRDNVSGSDGSGGSGNIDTYKVKVDSIDPTPGYLYEKLSGGPFVSIAKNVGNVGESVTIAFQPVVSATGSDVPDYLINKISSLNTPIGIESYNGKVNLTFDYSMLSQNLSNTPYTVWFSGSNGKLAGTQSFTFGDPTRLGALYTPSLQVMGSAIMGNSAGFWDDSNFTMNYPAIGGTVQLTPGYSNTKYIYAHNNSNNASVVTDKASFGNLANNGLVFAAMMPKTSDDLIYLNTATGLSYNPTSTILTAPKLAIGNLTSAGVLVNDASGNISTVPAGNFTDDHMLLVSSQDTIPSYLGTKLAAGNNIGFQVTTDSHGQKLWISARSNMLLNPTYVQANYTVVDTDTLVTYNGTGTTVTITLPAPGSTYDGRGIYISGTNTSATVTISGTTAGDSAYFTGIGQRQLRCLKMPNGTYAWIVRAN